MTEEEKLDAGLYYDFWDVGVNGRKLNAIKFCRELRRMQDADATEDAGDFVALSCKRIRSFDRIH